MEHSSCAVAGRYRRTANVAFVRQGGRTILMEPREGTYFSLDEIGGRLWDLLGTEASVDEAAAAIEAEYDAPAGVVRADLQGLLLEMERRGLVEAGA